MRNVAVLGVNSPSSLQVPVVGRDGEAVDGLHENVHFDCKLVPESDAPKCTRDIASTASFCTLYSYCVCARSHTNREGIGVIRNLWPSVCCRSSLREPIKVSGAS